MASWRVRVNVLQQSRSLQAWKQGSVFRDILLLTSGVGTAQAISFLAAPVLARLYSPDTFGSYAVFLSLVSIIAVAASGRYELAIPISRGERQAHAVTWLGVTIATGVSLVVALLLVVLVSLAPSARVVVSLGVLWKVVAPAVLAIAIWKVFLYWHTRHASFRLVAASHATHTTVTVGTQIGLAFTALAGTWGLGLGYIAGYLAAAIVLLCCTGSRPRPLSETWRWQEMRAAAVEHGDFLRFGTGQALLNSVSQNIAVLLITSFFAAATVGLYAFAYRVLMVPVNLIGNSVRQVAYQRLAAASDPQSMYRTWRRTTLWLALIALGPIILLLAAGPALFAWFLGDQWRESGVFAQVLAVPIMMALVNPPSTMLMPILGKQRVHLYYEAVYLGLRVCALVVGGMLGNVLVAVGLAGSCNVICNVWLMWYCRRELLARAVVEPGRVAG